MQKQKRRAVSLFLAALMLSLIVLPASAATSATAATIRLSKTTGTVNLTNSSNRRLSMNENMLLYNGYRVETKAKSYAWISLDSTKLAKLDATSKVEVRKSGKKLELLLNSGCIYFNVTSPLSSDETLNIRTSTMIVGIRGTSGVINVIDRWATEIYILEGSIQCSATDPVTGQLKTETVQAGEKAIATAYPQDQDGDKCGILLEQFESGDIAGFVLEELAQDPGLCGDIFDASGIDVLSNMGVLEGIRRQLEVIRDELDGIRERFEAGDLSAGDAQAGLDELRRQMEDLREQLEQLDPDDAAQRRLGEAEDHLRLAQRALDNSRSQEALDHLDNARESLEGAQQIQAADARQQGQEAAQDRLEQDERELQDTLDGIQEELAGQEENVSTEPVWEPDPDSGSGRPGTPGDSTDGDNTDGGNTDGDNTDGDNTDGDNTDGGNTDGDNTDGGNTDGDNTDGGNPDGDNTDGDNTDGDSTDGDNTGGDSANAYKMPLTDLEVKKLLDGIAAGEIRIQASDDPNDDNTLTIENFHDASAPMTIDEGKILTLGAGIDVVIVSGNALTVNGTMNGQGTLTNYGTLTNCGTLTVNSGNALGSIESEGILTNTESGRIVANDILISADSTNYGIIEGGVTVEGGTFTMNSGMIDGGSASAVTLAIGTSFIMNGGEITSSDDWATISNDGTVSLNGGTITNSGTGYVLSMPSESITFENTVIRAKQSKFLVTGTISWMPDDCTAAFHSGDGYYYLTKNQDVDDHGACGTDVAWSLDDGTLTIFGTGDMGDYSSGTQPWSGYLDQIKTVVIDNDVTSIGDSAFYGCSGLTGVTIPDSVTEIGPSAFSGCGSLAGVTIPKGVINIGSGAFAGCSSLTEINVESNDPNYSSVEGVLFNKAQTLLHTYPAGKSGEYSIPNSVTSIEVYAFYNCSDLTGVTIPGSVTEIGNGAFDGCGSLTDVSYGGSRIQWSGISGSGKPSDGLVHYAAYDITFDPNGGAFSDSEPVTAATNKNHTLDEETLANVPMPALDGFTFDGWFTEAGGGEKIDADTVFAADTTVYARWTPAEP